jgi:hypothetical protein
MRRLGLLFLSCAFAAACGGGGGDDTGDDGDDTVTPDAGPDPDAAVGTATINATWSVVNDGAAAACPPGATTAAVNALRAGDQDPYVDLYDCAAGAGAAADLPAGEYEVWVDLASDNGTIIYAQSESATLTLDDGELALVDFVIDGYNGFWDVSWTLHNANNTATTCAAVANQNGVSVLSTNSSTTDALDSVWNCTDGEDPNVVTNDPVPVGDYVVSVALLDNADNAIGAAPDIVASIVYGNEFHDLGTVIITLF